MAWMSHEVSARGALPTEGEEECVRRVHGILQACEVALSDKMTGMRFAGHLPLSFLFIRIGEECNLLIMRENQTE